MNSLQTGALLTRTKRDGFGRLPKSMRIASRYPIKKFYRFLQSGYNQFSRIAYIDDKVNLSFPAVKIRKAKIYADLKVTDIGSLVLCSLSNMLISFERTKV